MVESIANKITSFLISNKAIEEKESELYSYAFSILIAFLVNISAILIIAYSLNIFKETVLFLLCYCPIRQFTGGYHADNYKRCLLAFMLLYIVNICFVEFVFYYKLDYLILFEMIMSYIGICFLAPLEHRNNPLSKKELKIFKRVAVVLASIVVFLVWIGIRYNNAYKFIYYVASSIICIFIMLIMGIIKQEFGGRV